MGNLGKSMTANIQHIIHVHIQYCVGDNKSNVLRLLIKGKLHISIGGHTQCLPGGARGARGRRQSPQGYLRD